MSSGSIVVEPRSASQATLRSSGSFVAVLAALLMVLSVVTVRDRFNDPDLWWHLKTGQITWSTGHVPTTDLFSWTTGHHSWIPHEWLSQLFIYAAYAAHGFTGLMLWQCAATTAILLAAFYLCFLHCGDPKLSFIGAIIVWYFGTIGFAIRPQMVGYLLMLVELSVLYLGRMRDQRWFFLLPPLFALWVNCHGSFMLGIVVAGLYLATSFVSRDIGSLLVDQWPRTVRRTFGICLAASLLALLLNPDGTKLVFYPIYTISVPSIGLIAVTEWQPLAFGEVRGFGMLVLLIGILLLPMVSRARLYLHELVLLALGTFMALKHQRLLFAFGILAAPVAARIFSDVWRDKPSRQRHPFVDTVIIGISFLVAFLAFPSARSMDGQVRRTSPVSAVEFIRSHHLPGPMFNQWVDGGYLIWALPEQPVFIDGRGDIYDWSGVTSDYARFATMIEPPNLLLDKYHVRFCLLAQHTPMATAVSLLPGWQRVYADDAYIVLQRIN